MPMPVHKMRCQCCHREYWDKYPPHPDSRLDVCLVCLHENPGCTALELNNPRWSWLSGLTAGILFLVAGIALTYVWFLSF